MPTERSLSQPEIPHDPSAVFTVSSRTHIAAPAAHVFRTILDTSTWPGWNTFVPKCTIDEQPPQRPQGSSSSSSSNDAAQEAASAVLQLGTKMTLHVCMKPGAALVKQKEVVVEISTPGAGEESGTYRIAWNARGPVPISMLRAERVQEIMLVGEGRCEYVTWEHFGGPVAWMVKWIYEGTLAGKFEDWAEDLKGWCEGKWKEVGEGKGMDVG